MAKEIDTDNASSHDKPSRASSKIRFNSFFAGIGGFDLGFERAGFASTFHCELNSFCTSVLNRHWPKVKHSSDITKLVPDDVPEAEVWCGGFPCQDVSVARGWLGREGLSGKNTGLFFPFAELVKAKLPEVVLMENVTGLLNSHDGRDFAVILQTFQELGYGVAWRVFNTRYFGAPQSRPRVYICAWKNSGVEAVNALYETGDTRHPENPRLGFLRKTMCDETEAHVPEVAFCLAATSGRHTGTDWSRTYISYHDEVRRLTPTECERLQGFPPGWTLPSADVRMSDDDIDSARYHAIGNAVSVPVVEWVAKRIRSEMKSPPAFVGSVTDPAESIAHVKKLIPDFDGKTASSVQLVGFSGREDAPKIKWATGGFMINGECIMARVSPAPHRSVKSRLVDILDKKKPSSRYFLSQNAAVGIIRRVTNQERSLFEPLDAALRRLAQKTTA
jgi:DNA (cytosine-5)-methyltransferase 1